MHKFVSTELRAGELTTHILPSRLYCLRTAIETGNGTHLPTSYIYISPSSTSLQHHITHRAWVGEMAIKRHPHVLRHSDSATPSGGEPFVSLTPDHHAAVYSRKTMP